MNLFALAIAPGLAICLFIYYNDRHDPEPMRYLLASFILGMASTVPALIVQILTQNLRPGPHIQTLSAYAVFAYGIVGFSEETSKFLVLRFFAYPKKVFNEPFDGVVYAVMIGMGFATVENIEYVYRYGFGTGVIRFFLSVPAHASFAVLMGYYVGKAKFNPERSGLLMLKGLLVAVFFHGSYDLFLFLQQNEKVTAYVSTGLLSFGAFASFYISMRLAMKLIRSYQRTKENEY